MLCKTQLTDFLVRLDKVAVSYSRTRLERIYDPIESTDIACKTYGLRYSCQNSIYHLTDCTLEVRGREGRQAAPHYRFKWGQRLSVVSSRNGVLASAGEFDCIDAPDERDCDITFA